MPRVVVGGDVRRGSARARMGFKYIRSSVLHIRSCAFVIARQVDHVWAMVSALISLPRLSPVDFCFTQHIYFCYYRSAWLLHVGNCLDIAHPGINRGPLYYTLHHLLGSVWLWVLALEPAHVCGCVMDWCGRICKFNIILTSYR